MLDYLGRGFESYCLSYQFFSLSNRKNLDFHEHFLLEILSKCEIKAGKSSTLCIFHKGREGLRPMGSNADLPEKAYLIFPISLTGDVTSEIAEDHWERG